LRQKHFKQIHHVRIEADEKLAEATKTHEKQKSETDETHQVNYILK